MIRLAAAQVTPAFLDLDGTIAKAVSVIEAAGREEAQLVAFAEAWVPGYPMWVFGSAGWDDPAAKRAYARLHANSLRVPSPQTDALCDAARRAGTMVVMGMNECDADYSRGTLFNSLLYISAQGELMGVHRKLTPTHAERIIWGAGDGSTLSVFDTPIGRVGGLICWEHWLPLGRHAMHAKGEQIHVAAWPELPEIHQVSSRSYAFEGRCFVVCVGSYMRKSDVPEDFELTHVLDAGGQFSDDADELLPGGSGIIGPDGNWIVGPTAGREEIIYADVDLARAVEEQLALDTSGHYNRPDIFQLTVDDRPHPPVRWLRKSTPEEAKVSTRHNDLDTDVSDHSTILPVESIPGPRERS